MRVFTVRMDDELYREFKRKCQNSGISMNQAGTMLLAAFINRPELHKSEKIDQHCHQSPDKEHHFEGWLVDNMEKCVACDQLRYNSPVVEESTAISIPMNPK